MGDRTGWIWWERKKGEVDRIYGHSSGSLAVMQRPYEGNKTGLQEGGGGMGDTVREKKKSKVNHVDLIAAHPP